MTVSPRTQIDGLYPPFTGPGWLSPWLGAGAGSHGDGSYAAPFMPGPGLMVVENMEIFIVLGEGTP